MPAQSQAKNTRLLNHLTGLSNGPYNSLLGQKLFSVATWPRGACDSAVADV